MACFNDFSATVLLEHLKTSEKKRYCFTCQTCLVCFQDPSNSSFKDRMKEFMLKFDENGDGKIEMSEVHSHPFSLLK